MRHLVADLSVVTDFASRNLLDGLFQLRHQHFVEHQESLPEEEEDNERMNNRTITMWINSLLYCDYC